MTRAKKGSAFERDFCKRLSLWWSHDERDDMFWRTAGSGARSTTRSAKGKKTAGHYGDVSPTCPEAVPFCELFCIELKRGYPNATVQDILERNTATRSSKMKEGGFTKLEQFFIQTIQQWTKSDSDFWMLVTKRDRKSPLVWIPDGFVRWRARRTPLIRKLSKDWGVPIEAAAFSGPSFGFSSSGLVCPCIVSLFPSSKLYGEFINHQPDDAMIHRYIYGLPLDTFFLMEPDELR